MCAISGFQLKEGVMAPEKAREMVEKMAESMRHRGPDDSGIFADERHGVYLSQRRLSIIDLSPAGRQPIFNEDRSLAVLVNGEIYNYRELRRDLLKRGHRFSSECDVEVVAHLFEEKGKACWGEIRGMYAAAVFEIKTGKLHLARDPLGIKPLYLYQGNGVTAFASEIRAFQGLPGFTREWSREGWVDFLTWGSVSSPQTHFQNVRALRPGEILDLNGSLSSTGSHPVPRWCREAVAGPVPSLTDIQEVLQDSVRRHLISDAPIGVFLSGGIDSGTLAGLASECSKGEVHTVSVSVPGHELDESGYAQKTAELYGTRHTVVQLDQKGLEADLDGFFRHVDLPSIDGLNTYIVSKAARAAGLKVSLSGVGGDELFAGYNTFWRIPKAARIHRLASMGGCLGREMAALMFRLFRRHSSGERFSEVMRLSGVDIRSGYLAVRGLFMGGQLEDLLNPDMRGMVAVARERFMDETAWAVGRDIPPVLAVGGLELTRYMLNQLLRDTDVASMAHGLEVRTPLVDVEVIRTGIPFLAHPVEGDGHPKWLLRQSLVKPLPREVVERPKQGFVFPWQEWLRGWVLKDFDRRFRDTHSWKILLRAEKVQWWRDRYVDGWAHWSNFWAIYLLMRMAGENNMENQ